MSLTTQQYDILSRIAVGHGALVYRALEKATMRQVALKLLNQDGDSEHALNVGTRVRERAARVIATEGVELIANHLLDRLPVGRFDLFR